MRDLFLEQKSIFWVPSSGPCDHMEKLVKEMSKILEVDLVQLLHSKMNLITRMTLGQSVSRLRPHHGTGGIKMCGERSHGHHPEFPALKCGIENMNK